MQWAAVKTCWGPMRVPPHWCLLLPEYTSLTCQGIEYGITSGPPTILCIRVCVSIIPQVISNSECEKRQLILHYVFGSYLQLFLRPTYFGIYSISSYFVCCCMPRRKVAVLIVYHLVACPNTPTCPDYQYNNLGLYCCRVLLYMGYIQNQKWRSRDTNNRFFLRRMLNTE